MDKFNLLDCILRDGGYINNWEEGCRFQKLYFILTCKIRKVVYNTS
jgi:hypothetical protein